MLQSQRIKERLKNHFEKDVEQSSSLLHQLSLHIYEIEAKETDLHILAKILSEDSLIKIINYFDGDIIKIPTKEEYHNCLFLALCYYLKEIKEWSWVEIKEFIDLPEIHKDMFNSIILSRKINKIKDNIQKYLSSILNTKNFTIDELEKIRNLISGEKNSG